MMGAAISVWPQSDEREEFLCDFDRQTENSEFISPGALKSVSHSDANPGGGTFTQITSTNEIRRTASKTQIARSGETHLGYVSQDKLMYAIFQFEDSSTPVATLIGWLDSNDYYAHVVVPDAVTYQGKAVPVTTINDYCFTGGWGLTSLSIGKNVKCIGSFSFYGCSITELTVPVGVDVIMGGAFSFCPLNSIVFENPASLDMPIVIGDLAFAYTNISAIEIPARLKVVDDYSFRTSHRNPFFSCKKLESITINPKYYAANGPNRNFTIEIIQGALCARIYANDKYPEYIVVFAYPAAKSCEEFSLSAPFVEVYSGAFSDSNIGKISLTATSEIRTTDDDKVGINMHIAYNAFDYSKITELNISAKGPIDLQAPFALDCSNLSKYNLSESITNFKINNDAICAKKGGESYLVSYPTGRAAPEYTVPNEILHLADYCFSTNMYVKEITLPSTLRTIGNSAFMYCENLERLIYAGNSIESIGYDAFANTKIISSAPQGEVSLGNWLIGYKGEVPSNLVISETITNALPNIFSNNINVTSVKFPQNFENIPEGLFQYCENLKTVTFPDNLKTIGSQAFQGAGNGVLAMNSRSEELRILTIPDGVTEIGSSAFEGSRLGDKLVLPSSINLLGNYSLSAGYGEVEIHRSTPPENQGGISEIFNPGMLANSTLIIPKDAEPLAFTQNPYWNFSKIIKGDFASVNDVEIESGKIIVSSGTIYSTNGENFTLYATDGRVIGNSNSFSGLNPGIYIVHLGTAVRKYVIR